MDIRFPRVFLGMVLVAVAPSAGVSNDRTPQSKDTPHSRQKRILWITNDGRLALPPGTSMSINPSLSMPFIRHPPEGFYSNMTIVFPFTKSTMKYEVALNVDFDKLGLTDNENPYGTLPPFFARSLGRAAGSMMGQYIGQYLDRRRGKRSTDYLNFPKDVERKILDFMHGGERALLFGAVEDMLSNFGMDGRACLLRAICEINAHPLTNFGLIGEMLKLIFSASKSPYADLLQEYVVAENQGANNGECWPYFKDCPKSLFQRAAANKYKKNAEALHQHDVEDNNELSNDIDHVIVRNM